jgi:hypothetical protein
MSVLTFALSPSRDAFRSRMSRDQFRGQASRVRAELGDAGVGVFTEVKNRRETIRQVFGPCRSAQAMARRFARGASNPCGTTAEASTTR